MANILRTSELFKDDYIDRLIAKLNQLGKAYEDNISKIKSEAADLQKVVEGINVTTAAGREENAKAAKQADELAKANARYESALAENKVQIEEVKQATQTLNQLKKNEARFNLAAEGSYNQLAAQYNIIKLSLNAMSKAQRENTKEGRALVKQSKDIYEEMKRLQEETGKHVLNVGNYRDALADLPGPLGAAGRGVQGLSANLKALLANPVVLVLGLISGALITLFQAFQRSERGAQLMAKVTGVMNAGMSILVKVVNSVIDAIVKFADDPLEGLKTFGQAIVTNVINRFKGLLALVKESAIALGSLLTGAFDDAKAAAQRAGDAFTQAMTGLDAEQQRAFGQAIKEVTAEVVRQADAFAGLESAKLANVRANRELMKQAERLQTVEELQKATADDTTKSFAEREAAAEKARAALEARAAKEIQIAKNNLAIINQELDLRRANGENVEALLDQQLEGYRSVMAFERQYTLAVRDNEKQRSELKQDRLERDLDILIDGFDNQKTINERLLRDERLSLAERAKIYQDTARLADESLQKQIETVQQFTGIQVNANDLLATSDAVLLNQKIRSLGLSEIIEGRLLEIIRDRRTAVQDLNEAEKDLIKERVKALNIPDPVPGISISKQAEDLVLKRVREISDAAAKQARETLEANKDKKFSIYSLLGIEGDDQQNAANTALQSAKTSLNEYIAAIQKAADARVQASERAIAAAENEYNRQTQLQAEGLANNAETARQELELAKQNQRKALEEQRRAQRQQILIQSVEQASNLVTAISKVYATLGFPAGLIASGLMIGAFAAAKIKALQATKTEFAEGGFEFIGGGSHASGKDTPLGFTSKGKPAYAERGEFHGIVRKEQVPKYKSVLPGIINALNAGTFEQQFQRVNAAGQELRAVVVNNTNQSDLRRTEDYLRQLVEQGQVNTVINGNVTISKWRNWTSKVVRH